MELIIYGTNDGHRIIYESNRSSSSLIAYDRRTGSKVKSDEQFGKYIYSIVINHNGSYFFSKYLIIQDSLRSFSVGYIAFSVHIEIDERMDGSEILSFLDKLSDVYNKEYVVDYCINRGESNLIREDLSLFDSIKDQFIGKVDRKSIGFKNDFSRTKKEPAFISYENDKDLMEHFNNPFQEKFLSYKEILFIDKVLISKNISPLNLLQNSGEELLSSNYKGKYYFLKEPFLDQKLTIKKNNDPISRNQNNLVIGEGHLLEMIYSRKYCKPIIVSEKFSDENSNLKKYLNISGNQVSIIYDEFIKNLIPIEKSIEVKISDRKGSVSEDVKLKCRSSNQGQKSKELTSNDSKLIFKGDEIGEEWIISAEKGKNFSIKNQIFHPEFQEELKITLKEERRVDFFVKEEKSKTLDNIRINVFGKSIGRGETNVIFFDDEIDREYSVEASCDFQGDTFFGNQKFKPSKTDKVEITLKKVKKKIFKIRVNENGLAKPGIPEYSHDEFGKDIEPFIGEKNGYKFRGFKQEDYFGDEAYDGVLVAQFKKIPLISNAKVIAGITVSCILLGTISLLGWHLYNKDKVEPITKEKIESYTQGIELKKDQLDQYNDYWDQQKTPIPNKKRFWDYLFAFKEKRELKDLTYQKAWKDTKLKLDSAISKRNFINDFKIEELRRFSYSSAQEDFKFALNKIDSSNYEILKSKIEISVFQNLNLNEIKDKIDSKLNEIQNPINPIIEYLEGLELKIDSLKSFKSDSLDEDINHRIERAIQFREHLDKGEITKLQKMGFKFSNNQTRLKSAIESIDEKNKSNIGDKLNRGKTSQLRLNEIAEKIEELTGLRGSEVVEQKRVSNENSKEEVLPKSNIDKSKIYEQLQGIGVSKKVLLNLKKQSPTDQENKSIDLYLNFWSIVLENRETHKDFNQIFNQVTSDQILTNSDLRIFLEKIRKDVQSFDRLYNSKKSNIKRIETLELSTLQNHLK